MSPGEVVLVTALLEALPDPIRVFEWGSGSSSLYFSTLLLKSRRDYDWVTIEHNLEWYHRIVSLAAELNLDRLRPELVDFGGDDPRSTTFSTEVRDRYVNAIQKMEKTASVILVDGRFRRRCVAAAISHSRAGIVLLHDAYRDYYFPGWPDTARGAFVDSGVYPFSRQPKQMRLWMGSGDPVRSSWLKEEVMDRVDLPSLIQEAQDMHHSYNRFSSRAMRKIRSKMESWVGRRSAGEPSAR